MQRIQGYLFSLIKQQKCHVRKKLQGRLQPTHIYAIFFLQIPFPLFIWRNVWQETDIHLIFIDFYSSIVSYLSMTLVPSLQWMVDVEWWSCKYDDLNPQASQNPWKNWVFFTIPTINITYSCSIYFQTQNTK